MSTIERRLQRTISRIEEVKDAGLLELAMGISKLNNQLTTRLRQLRLLRWLVRIALCASFGAAVYYAWDIIPRDSGLTLELKSWNDAVSFAADSAELTFLLIPLVLALLFIERFIERASLLRLLSELELSNDEVYDRQFDDNPYATKGAGVSTDERMLEFLDCCTALLLLIRMLAQKAAERIGDRVILDRSGIVRRGAGDNHSRILMKIGILKANSAARA